MEEALAQRYPQQCPKRVQLQGTAADFLFIKNLFLAGHQWLTPVILVTWKSKIGRVVVQGQFG
jgi:hypothetical protein